MQRVGRRSVALLVGTAIVAAILATLLATRSGNASSGTHSRAVVKTMRNQALGRTILVNRSSGLTLYSLSAERHGRFICTTTFCLSLWKPLVVPRGTKPTGIRGLTVVKRPDGRRQVAYRGGPLYRFVQDKRPGQIKGNGFRDLGIWRPVVVGKRMGTAPVGGSSRYGY
jgi:predicted lipoprotein with Yx(FWY)xxD motif